MAIDPREFGRLESDVEALRQSMAQTHEVLASIQEQLSTIHATLAEAKGGWRALMMVGGASATLGAGVSALISHFHTRPPA